MTKFREGIIINEENEMPEVIFVSREIDDPQWVSEGVDVAVDFPDGRTFPHRYVRDDTVVPRERLQELFNRLSSGTNVPEYVYERLDDILRSTAVTKNTSEYAITKTIDYSSVKDNLRRMTTHEIRNLMVYAELELLSRPNESLSRADIAMDLQKEVRRVMQELDLRPSDAYAKVLEEWANGNT